MIFRNKRGFTLFQLVMILIGLGMAAAVAVRFMSSSIIEERKKKTLEKMREIVYAIHGNPEKVPQTNFGFVGDVLSIPSSLSDLVDMKGSQDWNGPYYIIDFDENEDDILYDAWGQPFTYNPTSGYISSTGGGTTLTQEFLLKPSKLLTNSIEGKVIDRQYAIPQGRENRRFNVNLIHKGNTGTKTRPTWSLNQVGTDGKFYFNNLAAGNYLLTVEYTRYSVVVSKYISLPPTGQTQKYTIKFSVTFYR